MKLNDPKLEAIYHETIKPLLRDEFGYEVLRVDEYEDSEKISPQILRDITRAQIILADLTGERPNCYYEVGYAHALHKKLILTAQAGTSIHFDLHDNRTILWRNKHEYEKKLRNRIREIQGPHAGAGENLSRLAGAGQ